MSKPEKAQQDIAVVRPQQSQPAVNEGATILAMIDRVMAMPDVPVEKVEQMFGLYQKVEADKSRRAYAAALAEMQAELPVVVAKGEITTDDKASSKKVVRSRYAKWEDICEAIRPSLTKFGFAISFGIDNVDPARVTVTCTLSHRDGHSEKTSMALAIDNSGGKNNVQGWGSAVSYAKRYTATAMLNIASRGEDDDGEATAEYLTDDQQEHLKELAEQTDTDLKTFLKLAKAESFQTIKTGSYEVLEQMLKLKLRRGQ